MLSYFLNSRQWEEGASRNAKELNLPVSKNALGFVLDGGIQKGARECGQTMAPWSSA